MIILHVQKLFETARIASCIDCVLTLDKVLKTCAGLISKIFMQ